MGKSDIEEKTDEASAKATKSSTLVKALQLCALIILVMGLYIYKLPANIKPVAYQLAEPVETSKIDLVPSVDIVFKNRRLMRGPESIAFDEENETAYVGTLDGRIMKLDLTNPHGSLPEVVANVGDPQKALPLPCGEYSTLDVCGRVLGIMYQSPGKLLYADASRGLVMIDQKRRRMDLLAGFVNLSSPKKDAKTKRSKASSRQREREPIKMINGLAIADDGKIYFTLTSRTFGLKDLYLEYLQGSENGALAVFDPSTKTATIVAKNLSFPNGVVLIENSTVALVSETGKGRILRIALTKSAVIDPKSAKAKTKTKTKVSTKEKKNSKQNKSDSRDEETVFQDPAVTIWSDGLPTLPDNLSVVGDEIWVAGNSLRVPGRFRWLESLTQYPLVRQIIAKAFPSAWMVNFVPAESAIVRMNIVTGDIINTFTTKGDSPAAQAMKSSDFHAVRSSLSHLSGATYHAGFVYLTSFHGNNGAIARFPWDIVNKTIPKQEAIISHKARRAAERRAKLAARKQQKIASPVKEEL